MLQKHTFTMLDLQGAHYHYGHSNNQSAIRLNTTPGFVKKEVDAAKKQLETIAATDTLAADDRVFFTPFSSVPRYKFNDFAKDKPKLSRTIQFQKATAIVLEPEAVVQGLKLRHYHQTYKKVKVSDLKDMYQHIDLAATMAIKTCEHVYFHDHYTSTFKKLEPNFQGVIANEEIYMTYSYAEKAVEEAVEAINDLLTINGTKKIISDQTMLAEINQGTIITPEMFDELANMLASSDNDTVGLAMEVMANSDYQSSELKILTLLNRFYDNKMYRHKNRGLVNFSSLLQYFEKYNWHGSVIEFSNDLVSHSKPESNDYEERIEMVRKNMLSYINGMLSGSKFSVNDVEIKLPVTTDKSQGEFSHPLEVAQEGYMQS